MIVGFGRRKKGMRNFEVILVYGVKGFEVFICIVFGIF